MAGFVCFTDGWVCFCGFVCLWWCLFVVVFVLVVVFVFVGFHPTPRKGPQAP